MEFIWSDKIGNRGRRPWLLIVDGDTIRPFSGESIPGILVVITADYEKSGKWSGYTYRLLINDRVRTLSGRDGWETGYFAEGLGSLPGRRTPGTWSETAEALGVSTPSAMSFLREWRPKAADRLDKVEADLAVLADAIPENDITTVVVSFGCPTNRMIADGWWEAPKSIPGFEGGYIALVDPKVGWHEGNIEVGGVKGSVISVVHSTGMHGGYYAVTVVLSSSTQ
jgi:hypothetical protein